ncbi:hypothetical protein VTJ04DRAFT_758 [Mycothermus thermophilus]|uniref:uncharacterized protein n=1 Tax=Humicola insolens TaxID=85995 RepID=UPI00374485ED
MQTILESNDERPPKRMTRPEEKTLYIPHQPNPTPQPDKPTPQPVIPSMSMRQTALPTKSPGQAMYTGVQHFCHCPRPIPTHH